MTRDDIEQAIYERTRRFVFEDVQDAILDLIAAEREACAKVCEEECSDPYEDFKNYEDTHTDGWMDGCNSCAAAIRARGETK